MSATYSLAEVIKVVSQFQLFFFSKSYKKLNVFESTDGGTNVPFRKLSILVYQLSAVKISSASNIVYS